MSAIERAAEEVHELVAAIVGNHPQPSEKEIASIIKRELEKVWPKHLVDKYMLRYNEGDFADSKDARYALQDFEDECRKQMGLGE